MLAVQCRHLQAGGFLFINNCSGYNAFDRAARALAARLFPDQKLAAVPSDDALFKAFHTIATGVMMNGSSETKMIGPRRCGVKALRSLRAIFSMGGQFALRYRG